MADFIDDFLAGLDADRSKPRTSDRITKMLMSSRDFQGKILFAPFKDNAGKFYYKVQGVRELRAAISKYKEGNDEVWIKILPKEFYPDMNEEESKLYDEAAGMFDQYEADYKGSREKYEVIRYRTYSIFEGVLLNHIGTDNAQKQEHLNEACLFIFPSSAPINAMFTAVDNKCAAMNGKKDWIPMIFAPGNTGREGAVLLSFSKGSNIGYDSTVGFEFNSSFNKIIDPSAGFPEDVTKKFNDMISDFIGWENEGDRRFSADMFRELKSILTVNLRTIDAAPKADAQPAPKNNNGVDPMIGAQSAPANPVTTPDASQQGGSVIGGAKVPF